MPTTLTPLTLAYFDKFTRAPGLTREQHAKALRTSPCVTYVSGVVEYANVTHGLLIKPSAVRAAVHSEALAVFRLGGGFHFSPADVDAWIESLRTAASA